MVTGNINKYILYIIYKYNYTYVTNMIMSIICQVILLLIIILNDFNSTIKENSSIIT